MAHERNSWTEIARSRRSFYNRVKEGISNDLLPALDAYIRTPPEANDSRYLLRRYIAFDILDVLDQQNCWGVKSPLPEYGFADPLLKQNFYSMTALGDVLFPNNDPKINELLNRLQSIGEDIRIRGINFKECSYLSNLISEMLPSITEVILTPESFDIAIPRLFASLPFTKPMWNMGRDGLSKECLEFLDFFREEVDLFLNNSRTHGKTLVRRVFLRIVELFSEPNLRLLTAYLSYVFNVLYLSMMLAKLKVVEDVRSSSVINALHNVIRSYIREVTP